jgi:hypothetical protein
MALDPVSFYPKVLRDLPHQSGAKLLGPAMLGQGGNPALAADDQVTTFAGLECASLLG